MPELPEAETIARGLRAPATGAILAGAAVIHADVLDPDPGDFDRALRGRRIVGVGRRGKNVVLELDDGLRLVVNLGMSGRLLWIGDPPGGPPPSHPAVILHLEASPGPADGSSPPARGGRIVYHDPRRFGRIQLLTPREWRAFSGSLGPEPLSPRFTARALHEGLAASRMPLRSWLLDQRKIAGVGNIYASEACHRARLHPALPANRVDLPGARRLHRAIRKVLGDAVAGGGTTLRDYRTAQGWEGAYQRELRVYGQEGGGCPRCGAPVRRIVFSNRSAFHCPRCQPDP
jgi:formamidopyrimidine-DNA glycosylase